MNTGNDFYYTGGGFSDWSGGSAGRFSSSSHGAHVKGANNLPKTGWMYCDGKRIKKGSYKYDSLTDARKKIVDEVEYGYPETADEPPTFKNYFILNWIVTLAAIILELWVATIYIRTGDSDAAGAIYATIFLADIAFCCVVLFTMNCYPSPLKRFSKRRFKWYIIDRNLMYALFGTCSVLVGLVPCLCDWLPDFFRYFSVNYLHDPGAYFYQHYNIGWGTYIGVTLIEILNLVPIIMAIPMFTRRDFNIRWTYYQNKCGVLSEKKKQNLQRKQEIKDEIAELVNKVKTLNEEYAKLEKEELP